MFTSTKKILLQVGSALKPLLLTATTAATTSACYNTIQKLRELEASPFKDDLKNTVSITSSIVNAFILSVSGVEMIVQLIDIGIWGKLSYFQQLMFATGAIIFIGGTTYSMVMFGAESNTFAAGVSATLGVGVANAVRFFANRINSRSDFVPSAIIEESPISHTPLFTKN